MMNYDFEEVLKRFKEKEEPEHVIVLIGKDDQADRLRRICLAWNKIKIKRISKSKHPENNSDSDLWEWLWDQIYYEKNELRTIVGIKGDISNDLAILIGNRIIYPDGTISTYATKSLRAYLKAQLGI